MGTEAALSGCAARGVLGAAFLFITRELGCEAAGMGTASCRRWWEPRPRGVSLTGQGAGGSHRSSCRDTRQRATERPCSQRALWWRQRAENGPGPSR